RRHNIMKLHELQANEGTRTKRKRLGRGIASGHGKTSGKGHKGQNARTGGGTRLGFEGGQKHLYQRLPKSGFSNINRIEYAVVNLYTLNRFYENTDVTPELLIESGIVKNEKSGIKVLAKGTLDKKLN